jgi:hypothetical protein
MLNLQFFSQRRKKEIEQSIKEAEKNTSGEIGYILKVIVQRMN